MRVRSLVSTLACLAVIPAVVSAADPSIKLDGFVDTGLTAVNTTHDEGNSAFWYNAKLGFAGTITETVGLHVDLQMTGVTSQSTVTIAGTTYDVTSDTNQILVRNAYGTWKLKSFEGEGEGITLKTGKFISDYGWVSAYAPGLTRVNQGPIFSLYGVDQVGANVSVAKGKVTAAFTVANGFFGESDNVGQSDVGQRNEAYAWGADVSYAISEGNVIDLEAVYDVDAGGNGGNGCHLAANVSLKPSEKVKLGAEVIRQWINGVDGGADAYNTGLLATANVVLPVTSPWNPSVTAMVQWVDTQNDTLFGATNSYTETEYSLALLTTPAGTSNLGLNFEVFFKDRTTDGNDDDAYGAAAELLYVVP